MHMTTTRPYLIRAFYEWIADNHCTPYIAVDATMPHTQVPKEYTDDGKIILNVSMAAVRNLELHNDYIAFSAQFGGRGRDIYVPIQAVIAIYAKENGKGMVFTEEEIEDEDDGGQGGDLPPSHMDINQSNRGKHPTKKGKPNLTLIK